MNTPEQYILSISQGNQLMAIGVMLKDGDLCIRGYEEDDEKAAYDLICDISEEIALQHGVE